MKAFAISDLPAHLHAQVLQQLHSKSPGTDAVMERPSGDGALGKGKVKAGDSGRVLVRLTSFRRRLLDEDNLSPKFFVDCLRYSGILSSDAPEKAKIEVAQVKVGMKEEEYTLIEVSPL